MEHKTWTTRTAEKAQWGPGPWDGEPDKEQWADEATGYACLIVRGHFGGLCGYVGVPEGHPWHGKDSGDIDAEAHGGLNYSDSCQEGPEGETICHVPAPGEPEPLWWVGFDCGHAWDISPGMDLLTRELTRDWTGHDGPIRMPAASYKTIAYVKAMCADLATQAAAANVSADR